jgi:hypothetical protein
MAGGFARGLTLFFQLQELTRGARDTRDAPAKRATPMVSAAARARHSHKEDCDPLCGATFDLTHNPRH